jgi:hypothetical protein
MISHLYVTVHFTQFAHASALCLQALEYSHVCKYACSEEVPELQDMGGPVEGTTISPPCCAGPLRFAESWLMPMIMLICCERKILLIICA